MNTTEQRIDDQDKSIDYSEPFLGLGEKDWSTNGGLKNYMNTASLTHKKGASAKLTFTGSFAAVYGIVPPSGSDSGTTSQYLIDGDTSITYTTKPVEQAQYDVKFFQSDTLTAGQHTLEVVNETEDGWLWLDYFVVSERTTNLTSTTASATTSTTSSTSSISGTSSTPSPTMLPSSASSGSTSIVYVDAPSPSVTVLSDVPGATSGDHHDPPAGVVLGAIFGTILSITLLGTILWLIRRKLADRYADQAAIIPTFAANSSSNVHKLALPSSNPNVTQDQSRHEYNVPVREPKIHPSSAATGGVQWSSYYQNHAPRLPPPAVPQLQPRSTPISHIPKPLVLPGIGSTPTDVFCAGNQHQSSYIPPPGLNTENEFGEVSEIQIG